MKALILTASILMASISHAAIHFNDYTDLPEQVQETIRASILNQCPSAAASDLQIREVSTEDQRADDGDGILFQTRFSVHGMDVYGDPANGEMKVETYMIVRDAIMSRVLSIQGLCR